MVMATIDQGQRRRPEKIAMAEEIRRHVEQSLFVILVDFTGLNSQQTFEFRSRLRQVGARMRVVPNRIFRAAVPDLGEQLKSALRGPTALILGRCDAADVARVLVQFAKEFQRPVVKTGVLGRTVIRPQDISMLATLPPRNVLLGQLVGLLAAPARGLVTVLNEVVASLPRVLKAIADRSTTPPSSGA